MKTKPQKTELGRLLNLPVDREYEMVNLLKSARGHNYIRRVSRTRSDNPFDVGLIFTRAVDNRSFLVGKSDETEDQTESIRTYNKIMRLAGHPDKVHKLADDDDLLADLEDDEGDVWANFDEDPVKSIFDDLEDDEEDLLADLEDEDPGDAMSLADFDEGDLVYCLDDKLFYTIVRKGQRAVNLEQYGSGKKAIDEISSYKYLPASLE